MKLVLKGTEYPPGMYCSCKHCRAIFAVEPSDCSRILAIKLKTTCPDCKMKNYYNKSDTAKLFWRAVPIRFFWLEQKTAYNEFQRKYAIYVVYFLYIF